MNCKRHLMKNDPTSLFRICRVIQKKKKEKNNKEHRRLIWTEKDGHVIQGK